MIKQRLYTSGIKPTRTHTLGLKHVTENPNTREMTSVHSSFPAATSHVSKFHFNFQQTKMISHVSLKLPE